MGADKRIAGALGLIWLLGAGCDEDPSDLPGPSQMVTNPAQNGGSDGVGAANSGAGSSNTGSAGTTGAATATTGASAEGSSGSQSTGAPGGAGTAGASSSGATGSSGVTGGSGSTGAGGSATGDAGTGGATGAATFPAVAIEDLTEPGPYTAKTVTDTGPDNGYTLYHPEQLAPDGLKNPIVTWGSGGGTTPDWYPMLPHLASHGFVVIATNAWPAVSGALLRSGIDWLLAQNEDPSSPFYQKLDPDNIAAMGYSMGSLATYEIGADPRLKTTVHIAGGIIGEGDRGQVTALHAPAAFICDADMTKPNCDGDFAVVQVPTFYGLLNNADHFSVVLDEAVMDRIEYAVTGWLRLYLMNDQSMKPIFVGQDCILCSDTNWSVQQKGLQ